MKTKEELKEQITKKLTEQILNELQSLVLKTTKEN